MPNKTLSIEQILTILAETPPRLVAPTAGLNCAQFSKAPNPDEWTVNEVLAHLRACADIWGSCMETIIKEDEPPLRAVNPLTWIKKTDYLEQEFKPSLHAFAGQRTKLLKVLRPCHTKAGHARRQLREQGSHSNGPCCFMHVGLRVMNGSTSSRSKTSWTRFKWRNDDTVA